MSDTPPDRKEEAGAPDGPRNPWVSWLVWLILAPVLYVLSVGPVMWLTNKGYIHGIFAYLYVPLNVLPDDIQGLFVRYIHLWIP